MEERRYREKESQLTLFQLEIDNKVCAHYYFLVKTNNKKNRSANICEFECANVCACVESFLQ